MRNVYLFPGILGSDRQFDRFCSELSNIGLVRLMSYPDVYSKTDLISNIYEIAKYFSNEIMKDDNLNEIFLIGYSFGGCVALEVGRILNQRGLEKNNIAIIDAPIPGITFDFGRSRRLGSLSSRTPLKQARVRVMEFVGLNRTVRLSLLHFCGIISAQYKKKVEKFILRSLRERGRRNTWNPSVVDFSGIMFFSNQFKPVTYLEWRRICPRMSNILIDASHLSLLDDPFVYEIKNALYSHLILQ